MSFHGDILKNHKRLHQLFSNVSKVRSLRAAKILHAISFAAGSVTDQTLFLQNNVLSMYVTLGELSSARKLFEQMPHRNVVSYNTLIGAYSKTGSVKEAWEMFTEMRRVCEFKPTEFTFVGLMSCEELGIRRAVQLQACAMKNGLFHCNAFVGTVLFGLYGILGFIDEAVCTFEDMPCKSLITWNSMLSLLGKNGFFETLAFLFRELMRTEASLSECSVLGFLSGFSSQKHRELGEQIHSLIVKIGLAGDISVSNSLITMYVKCAGIDSAEKVLEEMKAKDVVTWNTIIGAVARTTRSETAFELFRKMSSSRVFPTSTTYFNLITSCITMGTRLHGETIHAKAFRSGFESNVFVGTALIDFYSKWEDLEGVHRCFREISEPSLVSWNTMISICPKKDSSEAVLLLREMLLLGYKPNEFTFSIVLKPLRFPELCQVHSLALRTGYHENRFVLSSLITSYAKKGQIAEALTFIPVSKNDSLLTVPTNISAGIHSRAGRYEEALKLLSGLDSPDQVSWNIAVEALARKDYFEEAFDLLAEMNLFGIRPDCFTLQSLLTLCASRRDFSLGTALHGLSVKLDPTGSDSLIQMYRECGSVTSAVKVFDEAGHRDVATWTALISALGIYGRSREAFDRFREMEVVGVEADFLAVSAALTACLCGGLVAEATELFWRMRMQFGIEPETRQYRNLVELLVKTGRASEAEMVIAEMRCVSNHEKASLRSYSDARVYESRI